jgi:uncharacterized SAM-binding protein YcdF (DUF218 family)
MGAAIVLIVFSNPFLLNLYARVWEVGRAPLKQGKIYDAAIVLGGFTGEDKHGNGYFNEHSNRLIKTVLLKTTGRVTHILISGGNNDLNPDKFTEGAWVRKTLLEMNFPDSTILIDRRSKNTTENALFSKRSLDSAHLHSPYLLVTSGFHMRRALYDFRKKGVDVIPCPSDKLAKDARIMFGDYFVPDVGILVGWNYYIKELFGLAIEHLKP